MKKERQEKSRTSSHRCRARHAQRNTCTFFFSQMCTLPEWWQKRTGKRLVLFTIIQQDQRLNQIKEISVSTEMDGCTRHGVEPTKRSGRPAGAVVASIEVRTNRSSCKNPHVHRKNLGSQRPPECSTFDLRYNE